MKTLVSIFCLTFIWAATPGTAATVIPLDMTSGRPVVEIEVNGTAPLRMVLDTGARCSVIDASNPLQLSLARGVARNLELDGPLKVVGKGKTVRGTYEISAATLEGAVNLAGHTIDNPTLLFDKLHQGTQSNIGAGLLRQFVVTFDQRNHLVLFEKGDPGRSLQMPSFPPGLTEPVDASDQGKSTLNSL